jgi:hypothetical protein
LAQFDYTLDETSIGMTIGPPNGFVVNLTRTQAGPYDPPQWSEGRQRWKAGRFVLRGSNDVRDLVCIDTQHGGGWASHGGLSDIVMGDASIDYAGDLEIVCVPKGSTWTITLSDVPNPRAPLPTPGWAHARRGVRRRERPQAYPAVVEASRRPAAAPPAAEGHAQAAARAAASVPAAVGADGGLRRQLKCRVGHSSSSAARPSGR